MIYNNESVGAQKIFVFTPVYPRPRSVTPLDGFVYCACYTKGTRKGNRVAPTRPPGPSEGFVYCTCEGQPRPLIHHLSFIISSYTTYHTQLITDLDAWRRWRGCLSVGRHSTRSLQDLLDAWAPLGRSCLSGGKRSTQNRQGDLADAWALGRSCPSVAGAVHRAFRRTCPRCCFEDF